MEVGLLSLVGLLFQLWHTAEDLQDHFEIANRTQVCDPDAFEFAAEGNINSSFRLLCQQLVEVLGFDGDVVHATVFLGKETRDHALIPERLDQLPLQPPDHSDCHAAGALNRPAVFAQILRVARIKLVDLSGTDSILVDVFLYRRVQVAHDDSDPHRLGENRPAHSPHRLRSIWLRRANFVEFVHLLDASPAAFVHRSVNWDVVGD